MGHTQLCPPLVVKRPLQRMGIHHQDAPALRAAGDFDAEAASKGKMRHASQSGKGFEKSKKSLKMGFWRLFGPFSRLFFRLLGFRGRKTFSSYFLETCWLRAPRLPLPGPRNLNPSRHTFVLRAEAAFEEGHRRTAMKASSHLSAFFLLSTFDGQCLGTFNPEIPLFLRTTREGWNCRFQKAPRTEGGDKVPDKVPAVWTQGSRQVCLSRRPKSWNL